MPNQNRYETATVDGATPEEAAKNLERKLNHFARKGLRLRKFLLAETTKYIVLMEPARTARSAGGAE